ncbi:MAG: hypothetical protein AUG49_25265 [Catenulispora sp. 13_1_20CM_3_70_7]|nr:MAG: hypothetical protein AUG49_25265 [Catenulispora sp. 13_1_20CM_3_70_7]
MRVIAMVNQKGGVGKTATTVNLGAALAEAGQRVLMVDLDPQGHMTKALGQAETQGANLAIALLGQWAGELGDLVVEVSEGLYLIPTSEDMFLLEPQLYARTGREHLLSVLLDAMAPAFDVCLIDCPPSLGALTDSALVAARSDNEHDGGVIIPVQAEDSSLDALRLLLRQVDTLTGVLRLTVTMLGLVVNMYDARRGNVATSTMGAYQSHPSLKVLATIQDRKEVRQGWRYKKTVLAHAPESEAAGWYRDLAKAVTS